MLRITLVCVLFLAGVSARAQFGVYGMFSGGRVSGYNTASLGPTNSNGSFWAYGGTVGLYDDYKKLGPLRLGGDVRGFVQKGSHQPYDYQLRGGLAGLRLSLHLPALPFKPYVQGEIGGASTNYGVNPSRSLHFVYQVQAGADFTVFPHVDIRAEYGDGQFRATSTSDSLRMQQFGGGLVVRF